uniref:Uncharacterized protein n=1 Tax=Arundo donax TaxID=35708 RepID=A0A0A9FBR1_ARUDO
MNAFKASLLLLHILTFLLGIKQYYQGWENSQELANFLGSIDRSLEEPISSSFLS